MTSALLLLVVSALADVVPPAPDYCPRGARGVSTHDAEFCTSTLCGEQALCDEGEVCEPQVGLCVRRMTVPCGREGERECDRTIAQEACTIERASCGSGGTCEMAPRCVPRPPPAPARAPPEPVTSSKLCGCDTLHGGPPLVLLLGLLPLVVRSRRGLARR